MDMGFPSIGGSQGGYAPDSEGSGQLVESSDCSIVAPVIGKSAPITQGDRCSTRQTFRLVGRAPSRTRAARSSLRLVTPSLMYARCRWLLTVRTDRNRAPAIALLDVASSCEPDDLAFAFGERHRHRGRRQTRRTGALTPQNQRRSPGLRCRRSARLPTTQPRLRRGRGSFGRSQRSTDRLQRLRCLDEPGRILASGCPSVGGVRLDQARVAEAGQLAEAVGDLGGAAQSDEIVQQQRLTAAIPDPSRLGHRVRQDRATGFRFVRGDRRPRPAPVLLR